MLNIKDVDTVRHNGLISGSATSFGWVVRTTVGGPGREKVGWMVGCDRMALESRVAFCVSVVLVVGVVDRFLGVGPFVVE